MNSLEIPALARFSLKGGKRRHDLGILTGRQIAQLLGVGIEVVELWRIGGADDELPGSTADHHERGDGAFSGVFAIDGVVACSKRVLGLDEREEGFAVERQAIINGPAHEVEEGRQDVHG